MSTPSAPVPQSPPAQKTALIVDDFPSVRFFHSCVLEKAGFRCQSARDGQEALTLLRQQPVDLVVLDLVMPEMNGQAFITHLHASAAHAHIPVLIISSEPIGARIRRQRTATTGPVGFAQKPLMPEKIIEEVAGLLAA